MTSAGRLSRAMTLASVNVFPLPVIPRSTECGCPSAEHPRETVDGPGLIARGGELRGELEQRLTAAQRTRSRAPPPGTCATSRGTTWRADAAGGASRTGTAGAPARGSAGAAPPRACGCPSGRLHRRQAATTLIQVVCPPRDRGMTWSTVSFSPRRRAVLARVAVAAQDVLLVERDPLEERLPDVGGEADHRGKVEAPGGGPDHPRRGLDDLGLARSAAA